MNKLNGLDFQLTSSQGGWRLESVLLCRYSCLSTHILTRRMTELPPKIHPDFSLSTHILTRRMTVLAYSFKNLFIFQLTSSQGGWRNWKLYRFKSCILSTHILTRRMTLYAWSVYDYESLSTHILTRRMTLCTLSDSSKKKIFQLTSSQGGWQYFYHITYPLYSFNSHPHKEDDQHC